MYFFLSFGINDLNNKILNLILYVLIFLNILDILKLLII